MKLRLAWRIARKTYPVIGLIVLAAVVVGVVSMTLSPVVERDLPPVGPAVSLTVSGIPASAHAGDVLPIIATLKNNANRPLPVVLRMDIRNVNTTLLPRDVTVYAGCGVEEAMSTRTLRYYIGSHGPLLASNGTRFAAGTTVAAVETAIGDAGHWDVVLHEIETRDPSGYTSLISPGENASFGARTSNSLVLKVLHYFGMVTTDAPNSNTPADWRLAIPFEDTWTPSDGTHKGFLMELAPTIRGGFSFDLWAELPDGLGMPNHPTWTCGPLWADRGSG